MACVAFDLDETIGNFRPVWYLASFWSVDYINTVEQRNGAAPFIPSASLKHTLELVKETFATYLLRDKEILDLIIRPNIGELIRPLLAAKRARHLKTMIIYSNTGISYTIELAERLLQHMFKVPKLFSLTADWWNPLRTADKTVVRGGVVMHKRIETLQKLFQKALQTKKKIPLSNILFIDERSPRHTLAQQIPEGLTYLVPTEFRPSLSVRDKEYILFMAFAAMEQHGLLENREYLDSRFCHRTIRLSYPENSDLRVDSVQDLFAAITRCIMSVEGIPWKADSAVLRKSVRDFLAQVKP
jgi:hypothetical protein